MITGSSNFIGIVTAGFDNPFRSKLLSPLVHQLALNGFMPLLMNADDPQQLAPSLKQLLSYHVAGVIITSGAPPLSLAEEYLALNKDRYKAMSVVAIVENVFRDA